MGRKIQKILRWQEGQPKKHIRQLDSSQAEVKILCRGGEKPMLAIMTYLEEYQ